MMGSTLEKYAILHNFNLENAKQNNIDNFESLHYLTILTFTTGIILVLLSLCQAHFIAAYLSDSLVHGFTTAAAIHTIWSQIPKILGISVASRSGFLKLYYVRHFICLLSYFVFRYP
jgi:MFS superfamily sulfate permease-like transporter